MANPRIYVVLDRIAHASTTGRDLENSAAGLRRLLNGKPAAEVLRDDNPEPKAKHRSYDAWQEEIDDLRVKLKELESQNAATEREKSRLKGQIDKLQGQIKKTSGILPEDGHYTRIQVKQIIDTMFVKDHGVGKALVQRNVEQRKCDVSVPKITDSLLQRWRKANQYPVWMVEQLKTLTEDDLLPTHRWSVEDKIYIKALWLSNPRLTNEQLAEACSRKFGCKITDSSIRGVLNRAGLLRPPLLG